MKESESSLSPNQKRDQIYGICLTVLAAVLFSTKGIFAKLAYEQQVTVSLLLFVRFFLAFICIFFIAKFKNTPLKIEFSKIRRLVIFCCIVFFCSSLFDFKALEILDVAIERIILFTFPVFVIIFNSIIYKKPPSKIHIISFIIIQIGMSFVLSGGEKELAIAGVLWALAASVFYAMYIVTSKYVLNTIDSVTFALWVNAINVIFNYVYGYQEITAEAFSAVSLWGWLYLASIAILCTVIPFLALLKAFTLIGSNRASLINTIGPFFTIYLSHIVLGETFSSIQAIGGIIVISGIALSNITGFRGIGVGLPRIYKGEK